MILVEIFEKYPWGISISLTFRIKAVVTQIAKKNYSNKAQIQHNVKEWVNCLINYSIQKERYYQWVRK